VLREKVVALGGSIPEASAVRGGNHGEEDRLYDLVHAYEAKAKESLERVSKIDPDSYRAHQVLGDSYAAADRFDEAIPEYRMVLERKLDLPGLHGDLCNALSRIGRMEEAMKECDAEIAVSPYSADAYVQAARVHVLVDDNARAAALIQKAFSLDRPPIAAYKLKARIDVAQKRYATAIEALARYLAAESKDASAYFLLARAYKAVGDNAKMNEAIAAYKRTSDTEKGSGEAQRALDDHRDEDSLPSETDQEERSPL
jgi:tetratricopeptide (TPR) repeat protein